MPNASTSFQPTIFDKAFVEVVEYLWLNRKYIQKFQSKKDLLADLDILQGNYVEIKNGNRGVPKKKIADITKKLIRDYDVNERYLRFREGDITKNPITPNDMDTRHHKLVKEENIILKKDLELERAVNAELRKMIELQQKVIDRLKL